MPRTPTPSSATSELLAQRYGRAPRWSRPVGLATAAVVAVGGLAWVVWAAVSSSSEVSGQLIGFEVTSGSQVAVSVAVTRSGDAVRCEVYAQARDHAIVGETTFDVPAGGAGTVTVDHVITTERPAVSGFLRGCEVAPATE